MSHEDPSSPQSRSSSKGYFLKGCGAILALAMVLALGLTWIYKVESHHSSRGSIWWPSRGRSLIPPTARDISLQRDLLDHRAAYTVSAEDLNAFFHERFAISSEVLDSHRKRGGVDRESFLARYAELGWVWTEDLVHHSYTTSNGAASSYYHDPTTGLTYQVSAYW